MDKSLAQEFRSLLLDERAAVVSHLRQLYGDSRLDADSLVDNAVSTNFGLLSGEPEPAAPQQQDIAALTLVDAALRRLDAGVYGDCMDCGKPIAHALLRRVPHALRCATCQVDFDHSGKRSTY